MMQDEEADAFKAGNHTQGAPPVFRMLVNDQAFLGSESTRLMKYGVRDSDFAEIMQQRGSLNVLLRLPIEPEPTG